MLAAAPAPAVGLAQAAAVQTDVRSITVAMNVPSTALFQIKNYSELSAQPVIQFLIIRTFTSVTL